MSDVSDQTAKLYVLNRSSMVASSDPNYVAQFGKPDEVRTVVVLSGTFLHGYGEQWDETKLKVHPPGTFFSEPSKSPHFAWARDGEVVLQITATGPTATTNVEQARK